MDVVTAIATRKLQEPVSNPNNLRREHNFGKYYGLLIANADYEEMQDLRTPHRDVKAIAQILSERYGFSNEILIDATRREITRAFNL